MHISCTSYAYRLVKIRTNISFRILSCELVVRCLECQNVCDALSYLLDNIYIRFGTMLYRQIVGIPMGTNCAPLVADLFLYCYERDFMDSLNHDNQADVIEAFNSTSRYLEDLLNNDNPYFEGMANHIYRSELQLNKANISDTEAPFLDLHLSVANGFVSSKIYDKRDDFDIVNFPFLDGDVPRRASYGVYISQLIRFARVCNHVTDFFLFYVLVFNFFVLLAPYVCFHIFNF